MKDMKDKDTKTPYDAYRDSVSDKGPPIGIVRMAGPRGGTKRLIVSGSEGLEVIPGTYPENMDVKAFLKDLRRFMKAKGKSSPRTPALKGLHPLSLMPITRETLGRVGLAHWPHTFSQDIDEDDLFGCLDTLWSSRHPNPSDPHTRMIQQVEKAIFSTNAGRHYLFSTSRWAHYGFPFVRYHDPRYAYALMATQIDPGPIEPPWKTFLIELPSGFLYTETPTGPEELHLLLVSRFLAPPSQDPKAHPPGTTVYSFAAYTRSGVEMGIYYHTLEQLRSYDPQDFHEFSNFFSVSLEEQDGRTLLLLSRLVLNTCTAMSDPDLVRPQNPSAKHEPPKQSRIEKNPTVRVYQVGRDVRTDFREPLGAFLRGERRGPLTVQFLVRGHWRQQACGPKLAYRRPTWIEPYWKGPEDAPIPTRAHVLESR